MPNSQVNIVYVGDSLTAGTLNTSGNSYPDQCSRLLGGGYNLINTGVSSQTIVQIAQTSNFTNQVSNRYDSSYAANICVLWAGTNDLNGGDSGDTAYTNLASLCASITALGYTLFLIDCLPRSNALTPAGFETERTTLNNSIATNQASICTRLIQVSQRAEIGQSGDETNLTYYVSDRIHLNDTGTSIVAQMVAAEIAAYRPYLPPAPFQLRSAQPQLVIPKATETTISTPQLLIANKFLADLEEETANYLSVIRDRGGTIAPDIVEKLDRLIVKAGKDNGYFSKFKDLRLFLGDYIASQSGIVHIKNNDRYARPINFLSSDYSQANGLTANGSKYLYHNLSPLQAGFTTGNSGVTVYAHNQSAGSSTYFIGAGNGTVSQVFLSPKFSGNIRAQSGNASTEINVANAEDDNRGFWSASRISTTDFRLFRAHPTLFSFYEVGNNTGTNSVAPLPLSFHSFGRNNNNSQVTSDSNRYSLIAIHDGMTRTETERFYADYVAFASSIGRVLT